VQHYGSKGLVHNSAHVLVFAPEKCQCFQRRARRYAVGCRRAGSRKALDGILIETGTRNMDELHYKARWAIEGELLATHSVHYKLLDHEFDAASDDMVLWYASRAEQGGWSNRWPGWAAGSL
jgi:Family of unknown function (DUF6012)